MKKLLLLAVICGLFCSCSKDDDPANNANNVNNTNNSNNVNNLNNSNNVNNVNNSNNVNNMNDMGQGDTGQDMGPPPDPLVGIGQVTQVDTGFQFTEGPRWFATRATLLFTDIPANTIFEWDGNTSAVFNGASNAANGIAADADDMVLACEHAGRGIARYVDGTREDFITDFNGDLFNSPNDLVVASDGTVYFTDPPYGLNNPNQSALGYNGLFRRDPQGVITKEWEGDLNATRPNGVNLSPDGSVLYLADTRANKIYQFPVHADGSLGAQSDFADVQGPDGMAVDVYGNLYSSGGNPDGIHVFAPDGSKWGEIAVGERPSNCAFGGVDRQTLFITARTSLYSVDLQVRGLY